MSEKKKGKFFLLKTPISQIIFCVFSYKHFLYDSATCYVTLRTLILSFYILCEM